MRFNNILIPALAIVVLIWAYDSMEWMGVGMALTAMVSWFLLHYTRLIHIFNRASKRPIGFVDSAVMMHVKIPGRSCCKRPLTISIRCFES